MLILPKGPRFQPAAGGTTREAITISGATDTTTGGGIQRDMGTVSYTAFTFSAWCKVYTSHGSNETIFAGPGGTVQIYTGIVDDGVILARCTGGTAATTGSAAYSLDTWFHLHVRMGANIRGSDDVIIFINGTEAGSRSNTQMASTAMDGYWYVLEDDAATPGDPGDEDFQGELFDVGLFGSDVDVSNGNYSGGNWADFGTTPVVRLDGQGGDPLADSSGNGNNFSQSSGGQSTITKATSLPPGANP